MVIAAGSVIKDPNNGPTVKIENHQAKGELPVRRAGYPMINSDK